MEYFPFDFSTAAIRLSILSMSLIQKSCGIASHCFSTRSQSSCIPFGGSSYSLSFCFKCLHKCSMGLRSGDRAGQSKSWIEWFLNHSEAFLTYASCRCLVEISPLFCPSQNILWIAATHLLKCWYTMQRPYFLRFYMRIQLHHTSCNPTSSMSRHQILLYPSRVVLGVVHLARSIPMTFHRTQNDWF